MARRRRRRGRSGGEAVKIALGLVLALLAAGALGLIFVLRETADRPPALDAETLCPVDGPRAVTVVLVDGSDALPDAGQRQVTTALLDLAETLPDYGLLEVRLLDPADPGGRVLFHRCNPGTGAGLSEWTANPEAARRRWMASFREPIGQVLAGGLPQLAADTSPIMAAIQRVALDSFEGRSREVVPKALVVVSDMLENTPTYSQYGADASIDRYRASPAARAYATDLAGARVTLYYVDRPRGRAFDSAAHLKFWSAWIAENDGTLVEAVKLQGAG